MQWSPAKRWHKSLAFTLKASKIESLFTHFWICAFICIRDGDADAHMCECRLKNLMSAKMSQMSIKKQLKLVNDV